jgi:hypothetical protein
MRISLYLFIWILLLAAFMTGCSNSSNLPTQPPCPDSPQAEFSSAKTSLLYTGTFEIDFDTQTITQIEDRESEYLYDITGFLPDKCPGGCFRFTIVGIVGSVLEIELTLENPLALQAYDLRVEYLELFGKTVLNPDSWTDFMGSPIWDIHPFTAFMKESSERAFPLGPGGIDTETLFIDFPPGSIAAVNYVITASFPGQTLEPYEIGEMMQSGVLTPTGGAATISCRVDDHQDDVSAVYLDSTPFTGGPVQMQPDPLNPGFYTVEISNTNGASPGLYSQLIMALSPNPQGISTYNYAEIIVSEEALDVIYVDDSTTSGFEDGTQSNPYNTIQEGVDNCPAGWEVHVDDSGVPYDGMVAMRSDVHVKGVNWDLSDGGERPTVDPPDNVDDACCFTAYNVDNFAIETFDCYPGGMIDGSILSYFIQVEECENVTIRDCLFTGKTEFCVIPCYFTGSVNASVEYCRFDDLDRIADEQGMPFIYAVYYEECNTVTVRNCSFSDFRELEDEGCKTIDVIHIENTPYPIVHNNVIFSIVPLAAVGYMGAVLLEGVHIENCINPVIYNNTVSMLDSSHAFFINQCFAYMILFSKDGTFYNNIATHIYSSGWAPDGSPLARGVQSCEELLMCDYTCTFDIKIPSGEGAHYFQMASARTGCIDVAPGYIDPASENFDIMYGGAAQMGHPDYVDWDDTGAPSGDPGNTDPETRSRMGCHGGPYGEIIGLLTY